MGLSNFPSAAEGVLPVLVMNTVMSVAILKNLLKSAVRLMVATHLTSSASPNYVDEEEHDSDDRTTIEPASFGRTRRKVSITQFRTFCQMKLVSSGRTTRVEEESCSVCLCKFEEKDEVSELSCKHFFHRHCLENWFHNQHSTCPLCRSIDD